VIAALERRLAMPLQRIWYGTGTPPWPLRLLAGSHGALRRRKSRCRATVNPVPLIVVGNLVVGGSGKTPLVVALVRGLMARGLRVAVIARIHRGRGHGPETVTATSSPAQLGDEPLLLSALLECPVIASKKRWQAYDHAVKKYDIDVVVSDDGLQHRRLAADIEVVAVSAARGFGNGHLLPAGPLREPIERLRQVDHIVVRDAFGERRADGLDAVLDRHTVSLRLVPGEAISLQDGARRPLAAFAAGPVQALAGTADPEDFFAALTDAGLEVDAHPLPDHARPDRRQLRALRRDRPLLMTHKDAVKFEPALHPDAWYVPLHGELPASFLDAVTAQVKACRAR
jgi:tetraacyldisaccharide 4'-kinase